MTTARTSPSHIVRTALNYEPVGVPMPHDALCCMCGQDIKAGELGNKSSFSSGFTDQPSLARSGKNTFVCGDCGALGSTLALMATGHGCFSASGVTPFRKWVDVAAALTNPPEPPFVMSYATAKSQHMAWRSPVSLSRDVFYVRVGLRNFQIRRQRLLDAPAICKRLADAAYAKPDTGKKPKKATAPKGKTLPNPFVLLDPSCKDLSHGVLHPKVHVLAQQEPPAYPELQQDLAWIKTLTSGEIWALRFVLTPGAGSACTAAPETTDA